ncbi:MAG: GAF domain-containing protein, partial [Desulfobacterales bacterium]|nr:GAF domain-containing protein [Desulfobacterales bacterium]
MLTISRKDMDDPYSQEDVDAITSLLSNAAFTYENLRLLKKNEKAALQLRVIDKIFKIVNSSVRGAELIHSILGEIRGGVPADLIVLMTMDEHRPGFMKVVDLLAHTPTRITNEALIDCRRSVVEKTIEHENLLFIDEVDSLSAKADKALFIDNGAVSGVIAPLKTGGVVTGVLCLASRERAVFDGFRNLITWMAYGLSLAMER